MNSKKEREPGNFLLIVFGLMAGVVAFSSCVSTYTLDPQDFERRAEYPVPNIILILTDDQDYETLAYMPILQQELIGKGVNFTNAFVTTPLCCPSRASILTGQYAHNHGVLTNKPPDGGVELFDDSSTLATWLQDAGYRTSFIGKYLNGYERISPYIPPGWDDWRVFAASTQPHRYYRNYDLNENGEIIHYGTKEKDYSADVMTEKGVEFILNSADQPFFLFLSYYAPHQPRKSAKRHENMFKTFDDVMPFRTENFNEEDVSDKPEWLQEWELADVSQLWDIQRQALRSLMPVDEAILELLNALELIQQQENTVIIFISDNGIAIGDHRLTNAKNCPYEECIQVPFVIYYPGVVSRKRVDDSLVLNIDLAPTIADLAGAAIPSTVDGVSILPLLKDPGAAWRDEFVIEHWSLITGLGDDNEIPDYVGIRTQEWKYVRYVTGELELYHLSADPFEMTNLAYDEAYAEIVTEMDQRLNVLLEQ